MIHCGENLVAHHRLQSAHNGWVTVPEHHQQLWRSTLKVERRSLQVYEEAGQWS